MHSSGCPYAHSTVGDHYAVASHADIMAILKSYDVWKSNFGSTTQNYGSLPIITIACGEISSNNIF